MSDLRVARPGQVDIRDYPNAISEDMIGQANFRRGPVMRGCTFADSAFLCSRIDELITMDQRDRSDLEFGLEHGLRAAA